MTDSSCFYVISKANKDEQGAQIALTAHNVDMYAPFNTGVFPVISSAFAKNEKRQQWKYDASKQIISNIAYPGSVITEGVQHNLYLYMNMNLKN